MLQTNEQLVALMKSGSVERMSKLSENCYLVLWRDTTLNDMWQISLFDPVGSESAILELVRWDSAVELFEQTFNNLRGK